MGGSIKDQVDAYTAGMEAAAEKSRLVDAGGEFVESLPHCLRGGSCEVALFLVGVTLTFANREGEKFTREVGLDALDGCSCCLGHDPEPTGGGAV